jgi:23S rRNA pseudouridine1911/1915/1917 synthase
MIYSYIAVQKDIGKRLDNFVLEKHQDLSRSHIKVLIENGNISINQKAKKAGEKIRLGDTVVFDYVEPKSIDLSPENIEFEVVYEDEDLLVINKPQGLVVHPSSGTKSGTLVNGLLFKVKDLSGINGKIRPGIVHRLDKNTSGLMLVAKNDKAHVSLSSQIYSKSCKIKYMALLEGVVKTNEGRIETFISRSHKDRKLMAVSSKDEGKIAVTDYRVIKRFSSYTLCEFSLLTGRTHQIRVHAKHIGFPVVGDKEYGKEDKKFGLNGQLLHSYYIEFKHPVTFAVMHFEIPLPNYFLKVLDIVETANQIDFIKCFCYNNSIRSDIMSNVNASLNFKRFINFVAFLATCLIAVALVVQVILGYVGVEASIIGAMRLIGEIIAYLITVIAAFSYIRTKKSPVWSIVYAICATVIVVLLILR